MELVATSIFGTLRDDEIEIMQNAPAMVTILIAGADNHVDKDEVRGAINYTAQASGQYPVLSEFLEELKAGFKSTFTSQAAVMPKKLEARQDMISTYLGQLNDILPKLDVDCAMEFYKFLLDLAKAVAGASGGILGMNKISKAEAKYLSLDMIEVPV